MEVPHGEFTFFSEDTNSSFYMVMQHQFTESMNQTTVPNPYNVFMLDCDLEDKCISFKRNASKVNFYGVPDIKIEALVGNQTIVFNEDLGHNTDLNKRVTLGHLVYDEKKGQSIDPINSQFKYQINEAEKDSYLFQNTKVMKHYLSEYIDASSVEDMEKYSGETKDSLTNLKMPQSRREANNENHGFLTSKRARLYPYETNLRTYNFLDPRCYKEENALKDDCLIRYYFTNGNISIIRNREKYRFTNLSFANIDSNKMLDYAANLYPVDGSSHLAKEDQERSGLVFQAAGNRGYDETPLLDEDDLMGMLNYKNIVYAGSTFFSMDNSTSDEIGGTMSESIFTSNEYETAYLTEEPVMGTSYTTPKTMQAFISLWQQYISIKCKDGEAQGTCIEEEEKFMSKKLRYIISKYTISSFASYDKLKSNTVWKLFANYTENENRNKNTVSFINYSNGHSIKFGFGPWGGLNCTIFDCETYEKFKRYPFNAELFEDNSSVLSLKKSTLSDLNKTIKIRKLDINKTEAIRNIFLKGKYIDQIEIVFPRYDLFLEKNIDLNSNILINEFGVTLKVEIQTLATSTKN